MEEQRSLANTPTWTVATVTTVLVAVCFLVQRSIYRFGKWLMKTRRKALLASLEKIKEELMILGLISLMLGQWARWISNICVDSSLFSSRFYPCTEDEVALPTIRKYAMHNSSRTAQQTMATQQNYCAKASFITDFYFIVRYLLEVGTWKGKELFVSYESLEQLHRFLFLLGITHVLYSGVSVVLAMVKIYSWRKWENQGNPLGNENLQVRRNLFAKRQSTFVFHHASHPWSRSKILIWMLCLVRQFKSSVEKSDYMALRLGFITKHRLPLSYDFHKYIVRSMEEEFQGIVGISWGLWVYAIVCIFINIHGLNAYFWLSFIPAVLVVLVGTKLEHVVMQLALEIVEASGPFVGTQLKPRDDLFWFRKPEILLWLIQFISFQNAFEMATFLWSLWGLKTRSCFMRNQYMIVIRLVSGVIIQFWCSYSTVPLNVIVTQMGSRCKKALLTESVRESLHSWCKRVKEKSKRDSLHSYFGTTRSTCSLESIIDERDETATVGSGTLSRSSSIASEKSISFDQISSTLKENMSDPCQHQNMWPDANHVSIPTHTTLADLLNFQDNRENDATDIDKCEDKSEFLP